MSLHLVGHLYLERPFILTQAQHFVVNGRLVVTTSAITHFRSMGQMLYLDIIRVVSVKRYVS